MSTAQRDKSVDKGRIGIAGAGRVGAALGRLLHEGGQPVVAVASREPEHARQAAEFIGPGVEAVSFAVLPSHASRLILAVPDDAISVVASQLAAAGAQGGIALHTCGAHDAEVLAPLAAAGFACGTLHPLQTVATPEQGLEVLLGIAFAVSGDAVAVAWAEEVVSVLEGQVLRISSADRALYHAAAVVASNCVVGLVDAAVVLMGAAGVERDKALQAITPLVRASTENALRLGPDAALTGPIERGDAGTVRAHLAAMGDLPEAVRDLYAVAGRHLLTIARRRGLEPQAAQALERILRESKGIHAWQAEAHPGAGSQGKEKTR